MIPQTEQTTPMQKDFSAEIPAKFWDSEKGVLRTEALLKSYLELERKLSSMIPAPTGPEAMASDARLRAALGVPDTPDAYDVKCDHGLFDPDPEVTARLHAAGMTPGQVQAVYDLAAERLLPMIADLVAEFQADREVERLVAHFGGKEKWQEISRQLFAWGQQNLPEDVLDGLSASYEGILALYRMMGAGDGLPEAQGPGAAGQIAPNEAELYAMMRDPRYWRDKDPAFIEQVTSGFQNLYGAGS